MCSSDLELLNSESTGQYEESHRSKAAKDQDVQWPEIQRWLRDPSARLPDITDKQYDQLVKNA